MDALLCVLADAPRQHQALLEVSQSVASHRDLTALFRDLVQRLPCVVSFDSLWLVLHDPDRNRMRLHVLEGPAREAAQESAWPLDRPMEESPSALVWSTQEPLVVANRAEDRRYLKAFQLAPSGGNRSGGSSDRLGSRNRVPLGRVLLAPSADSIAVTSLIGRFSPHALLMCCCRSCARIAICPS